MLTEVELEAAVSENRKIKTYFIFALIGSFVTILISIFLFVLRKRIDLMITIFEESGKAICNMTILFFQPMLVRTKEQPNNYNKFNCIYNYFINFNLFLDVGLFRSYRVS